MQARASRAAQIVGRRLKAIADSIVSGVAVGGLRLIRFTDRKRTADALGWLMRKVGPWLPEHRVGRANIAAAFPDKSAAEIDQILSDVWDNLGRFAAEFAHIDRIQIWQPGESGADDVIYDPQTRERFQKIRDGGKPALLFSAHLANWEIPALAGPLLGVDSYVLYRRPNLRAVGDAVVAMRARSMGTLIAGGPYAPIRLARALESGGWVGMLVDQYFDKGVEVSFFGRPCKANPLLAQLAKHVDCVIHGVYVVRLPDRHRFWGEITEAIEPVRDAHGEVDIQGTMQAITSTIEGWVRAHPEQWLWLHRRWR